MVAIVAILLLGSLFWSAVGALLSAASGVTRAVSLSPASRVTPTAEIDAMVAVATSAAAGATVQATARPTAPVAAATATPPPATVEPTAAPEMTPAATANPVGRPPWILLPEPEPGARISAGSVTVGARGRGDAPITEIRLELDGGALEASLDQRSDVIWRAQASASVGTGRHAVRALVVDAAGRTGSYRWTFEAAPP